MALVRIGLTSYLGCEPLWFYIGHVLKEKIVTFYFGRWNIFRVCLVKGCYFSLVLQREWIRGWRLITLFHGHGEYRHISLGPVEYFWLALTVIFPACSTKYATSCNIVQVCACSVIDMNEKDRPLWKSTVAPVSKHLPSWTWQKYLQTLNSNVNLGWRNVVFFICLLFFMHCTLQSDKILYSQSRPVDHKRPHADPIPSTLLPPACNV